MNDDLKTLATACAAWFIDKSRPCDDDDEYRVKSDTRAVSAIEYPTICKVNSTKCSPCLRTRATPINPMHSKQLPRKSVPCYVYVIIILYFEYYLITYILTLPRAETRGRIKNT